MGSTAGISMGVKGGRHGSRVGLVVPLYQLKAVCRCCVAALGDPAIDLSMVGERAKEGNGPASAGADNEPERKILHGAVIVTKKRANTSCLLPCHSCMGHFRPSAHDVCLHVVHYLIVGDSFRCAESLASLLWASFCVCACPSTTRPPV